MRVQANQRLSRRSFTWSCGAALAAWCHVAGKSSAADLPKGQFVDVHTHLGQTWNTTKPLSAGALLEWMDANQVAQAVVLPLVSPESSSYPLTTDFVLAETREHRDRLIPFCSVDPRASYTGGQKGLVDMLRRYVDQGAKGFGEHKVGIPFDDPRNMTIYAACGELRLPLLFHIDNERNMDRPGLPRLENALAQHPNSQFIGHGPGWWASISGEVTEADLAKYPTGPVKPGGAIDRLMDKYPNLRGDLSAGSGAGAISRDLDFGRQFMIRRADRLMFGTDFLSPGQPVPQFALVRQLQLPAEIEAKIFRDNARRLLGLT
ncbi:MAG TPA: amidohydrolase family protein [Pirellulales bacterium]|jgi:predicted TIM-barrel fold metal-dependent hydrolase|nr:amidohydrolase family protein [Pirellulales bacterium]